MAHPLTCDYCNDTVSKEVSNNYSECNNCHAEFCGACKGRSNIRWGRKKYCSKCIRVVGLAEPLPDSAIHQWYWSRLPKQVRDDARVEFERMRVARLTPNDVCCDCGKKERVPGHIRDGGGLCNDCETDYIINGDRD